MSKEQEIIEALKTLKDNKVQTKIDASDPKRLNIKFYDHEAKAWRTANTLVRNVVVGAKGFSDLENDTITEGNNGKEAHDNLQQQVNDLDKDKQNKKDNTLNTDAKTITGAINELNNEKVSEIINLRYGDFVFKIFENDTQSYIRMLIVDPNKPKENPEIRFGVEADGRKFIELIGSIHLDGRSGQLATIGGLNRALYKLHKKEIINLKNVNKLKELIKQEEEVENGDN